MAEVSFGPGAVPVQAPQVAPSVAQPVEVVGVPATVPRVTAPVSAGPSGLLLGDKIPDFSEIVLPRVNLAQGIGKLKDTFLPGTIVLGQQVPLFIPPDIDITTGNVRRAATPPVEITVLGFRPTRFVEKVAGGARGAICNTEDEVRAQGGTLDYKEWKLKAASGMKRFEYYADALVLIRRPDSIADDDTVFVYKIEGAKYALAMWGMKGTIYTAAAKKVFFTNRRIGCLMNGGYPSKHFSVSTRLENWPGGNSSWIPICVAGANSSPEFLQFVNQIIGNPAEVQPVDPGLAADAN